MFRGNKPRFHKFSSKKKSIKNIDHNEIMKINPGKKE